MRLRRTLLRTALGLALVAAGAAAAWRLSWRSPPPFTGYGPIDLPAPILTADEYAAVSPTHPRPYLVEVAAGRGAVLLYGSTHTKDPADPQLADLARRWDAFAPTVAFVEGRPGGFLAGLSDPVRRFGEGGLVCRLARDHGVPLYTWELPPETEVARVLGHHPKERVALFYVLRPYFSDLRHGKPADPDGAVERVRGRRTRIPGLEGTFGSVADIDAVWRRDFPGRPDWRDTSDEYGLPGYLHEVWTTANAVRDEHFARVVVHRVRAGERVFAVAGSSHAVKLDPALRAALADR